MASSTIFRAFNIPIENKSLIVIIKEIIEGKYKNEVEQVRAAVHSGNKDEADRLKKQLLAFTPSATFSGGRKMEHFISYSQFIILDIDKLTPEQLQTAFNKANSTPYTFACFRSPSGNGIKILVQVNTGLQEHKQAYQQVADFYQKEIALPIDPSGKDVTRLCFVSYDPQAYKNINSKTFQVTAFADEPQPKINKPTTAQTKSDDKKDNFQKAVDFTNQKMEYVDGNRNNYVHLLACNCNRNGISEAEATSKIKDKYNYNDEEVSKSIKSAYANNENEFAKFAADTSDSENKKPNEHKEIEPTKLPTLPDEIFPELPEFLQKVLKITTSKEERDILLLGTLVTLSACFHKLYGVYDGKRVFPNLFLFITAQASAGKGRLVHCKQLVKPIHKHYREQAKILKQQHELEMMEFNNTKGKSKDDKKEKPLKPAEKMLFIPANNSTTGVFQLLFDNDGRGLIFETEGDTLAQAFKSDYGNYSDGFRKAFHHETISYYRRTDREYVDIENPCLSTVLTGTPKQVSSLIPNAENGLFSRFIFYFMNVQPVWKNVFAISSENGLDDYFDNLGNDFFSFYKSLIANPEIQFCLTAEQENQFNIFFNQMQNTYLSLQGLEYMATVRRLGLIAFRIAMILSVLRIMETGEISNRIICEDNDFNTALAMIKILVKHASKVFSELPAEQKLPKNKNQKEKFLDTLPANFNRQFYLKIAATMEIPDKTAEGYITNFCKAGLLHREKQDHYQNPNAKQIEETKDLKD